MASINPSRLKEARIIRELTVDELASQLSVTKQAVSKYENGKTNPSPETIIKISQVLDVPLSFLTKEDLIKNSDLEKTPFFFRTVKTTKKYEKEYAHVKLKWAYEIINTISELLNINSIPNLPDLSKYQSIEEKSMALRQYWGIGLEPISNMVNLLEENLIPIFCINTNRMKIDAYSQIINGKPIIIINSSRGTAVRWRFDIAHELGHLILHKDISKSDLEDPIRYKEIEKEANTFASAFLLPKDSFGASIASDKLGYFLVLKKKWMVSISAMIYRAKLLGVIGHEKAERILQQISSKGWRKEEPLDSKIMHEMPSKVKRMIGEFVYDKSSASNFVEKVRMSTCDVEEFVCLEKGFFDSFGLSKSEETFNLNEMSFDGQLSFLV